MLVKKKQASKMTHIVKVSITKPNHLNLILGTHMMSMMRGEN